MKAIIDILKENNLYTFMLMKEQLLVTIDSALRETEYANKYALSGSFTSTDLTISLVVGVLAEKPMRSFLSSGSAQYMDAGTSLFREYTYGINITGINDEEVKSISKYLYYKIIEQIPDINRAVKARLHPDLYMQPMTSANVGDKRMWSVNIYATTGINEIYMPRIANDIHGSGTFYAGEDELPEAETTTTSPSQSWGPIWPIKT